MSGRMFNQDKPSLDELVHHGVKGMHWGIRRDRESSGSSNSSGSPNSDHASVKKAYMDVPAIKRSPREAAAALAANNKKFVEKIGEVRQTKKEQSISKLKVKAADLDTTVSDLRKQNEELAQNKSFNAYLTKSANKTAIRDISKQRDALQKTIDAKESGKLTPTQKKLLIGAVVVGGLVAYNVYRKQNILSHAGLPVSPQQFHSWTLQSKFKTWGKSGYIQDSSFAREEFTIPLGETFHRLSSRAEEGLNPGAYVTSGTDDFNRYVAGFRNEVAGSSLHHISFTASKPIKVPDLTNTLETLRESMEEHGLSSTPRDVRKQYETLSGGRWAQLYSAAGVTNSSSDAMVTKSFMDRLLSKGYGAFVDEMDAGVIGDKPLVFIDHSSVKTHATKLMSAKDIAKAESNLKELTNRKL